MNALSVLFICVHNSCRSRMAEAIFNHLAPAGYVAESAGLEPRHAHPLTMTVMREIGINIFPTPGQNVFELFRAGRLYDYVITLCDATAAARCPVFTGATRCFHWSLPDPGLHGGALDERLAFMRHVRDQIMDRVDVLIQEIAFPRQPMVLHPLISWTESSECLASQNIL